MVTAMVVTVFIALNIGWFEWLTMHLPLYFMLISLTAALLAIKVNVVILYYKYAAEAEAGNAKHDACLREVEYHEARKKDHVVFIAEEKEVLMRMRNQMLQDEREARNGEFFTKWLHKVALLL